MTTEGDGNGGWSRWGPTLVQLIGMAAIAMAFVLRLQGQTELVAQSVTHLSANVKDLRVEMRTVRAQYDISREKYETMDSRLRVVEDRVIRYHPTPPPFLP